MRTDIVCGLASNPTDGLDQRQPGFLFPQSERDACIAMFAVRRYALMQWGERFERLRRAMIDEAIS
ncbi:MAG: hypothetical protein ACYCYO_21335 [Bacilli bacterium]